MKNGLIFENGELFYYKDNTPFHAGVIKDGNDIYYIGSNGKAVKGEHAVHSSMTNGIISCGTYIFGNDYKLIRGSYNVLSKSKPKKTFLFKKRIDIVLLFVLAIFFLGIVVVPWAVKHLSKGEDLHKDNISFSETDIILPTFDSEVLLFSKESHWFYNDDISYESALNSGNPYRPLKFKYTIYNGIDGKMFLSESEDFSVCKEVILPHDERYVNIDNLKTGTTYYYKVENDGKTYTGSFRTAKGVRFIHMEGLNNARDIGGYETLDGKTVKQGYIIRGAELDGLSEPSYIMDSKVAQHFQKEFGFVYDMDLRNEAIFMGDYVSRLGENIRHDFYDSPAYGTIFNSLYKEATKNIFSALAKEENYPMYFHCTHGVDRTGSMIFLLQGILNVSESKMKKEYLNSGFAFKGYVKKSNIESLISLLDSYEGETINEKIENFLLNDIGVTREEIEAIRKILLED